MVDYWLICFFPSLLFCWVSAAGCVCRYYYQGECVETCPDGFFKSTLLPRVSSVSETVPPSFSDDNVNNNNGLIPASSSGEQLPQYPSRECLPCHWTCASCQGQLSTDCLLCPQGLLWSHGRCLHTCDYLWVWVLSSHLWLDAAYLWQYPLYHSNVPWAIAKHLRLIAPTHVANNPENLVQIGAVFTDIIGQTCQFLMIHLLLAKVNN